MKNEVCYVLLLTDEDGYTSVESVCQTLDVAKDQAKNHYDMPGLNFIWNKVGDKLVAEVGEVVYTIEPTVMN